MFDQNGMWQDDIYHTPGSMGTPALDLMNVMQSGQNYQQEHAAKMQAILAQILASPNAPALLNSPDAAPATGLTPDQLTDAYANTPGQKFRNLYGQMSPDDQTDPDAMLRAGITSGAEAPNAALASNLQYNKLAATNDRNERTTVLRLIAAEQAKGTPGAQISAMLGPDTLQRLGIDPTQLGTAGLPAAQMKNLNSQAADRDSLTAPKAASLNAGAQQKQAQATLALTKSNWYPLIASATAQNLLSSSDHKEALTAATDLATSLKGQQAQGALTPQGRIDLQQKTQRAADSLRKMQADPAVQAEIKKNTPAGQSYKQIMQAMTLGIQQGQQLATTAPSVTLPPPKGGSAAPAAQTPAAVAPVHFNSLKEFVDGYIAQRGVAPTDEQIAKAKQLGYY